MKTYGLDLQHSDVNSNADVIVSGSSFPTSANKIGTIFFLNTSIAGHDVGLYTWSGTSWITGDITSVIAGEGLVGGGIIGDVTLSLPDTGITAGTYEKVVVDKKGRITSGSLLSLSDVVAAIGYTPYDKNNPSSYISTNKNISITGDATGSGNIAIALTLANSGITAGTYTKLTVDSKGRATVGTTLASSDVTTALGFTPYNATNPSAYISANQNIVVSGDATGSGNTAIALTLANSGVTAGTYHQVTVDGKGRVTSATNLNQILQCLTGNIAITSGTSSITYSTAVPASTAGTQLMSQSITPVSATSDIVIELSGLIDCGTTSRSVIVTVFRGTTFIGGTSGYFSAGLLSTPSGQMPLSLKIIDNPNTTSAVTYSIRIGASATSTTWYFGRSISETMGGTNPSGWSITEVG